jgi:hypothetical protein
VKQAFNQIKRTETIVGLEETNYIHVKYLKPIIKKAGLTLHNEKEYERVLEFIMDNRSKHDQDNSLDREGKLKFITLEEVEKAYMFQKKYGQ